MIIIFNVLKNPWNIITALKAIRSNEKLVLKGQGEGDTKWKGCDWNKLLISISIVLFIY